MWMITSMCSQEFSRYRKFSDRRMNIMASILITKLRLASEELHLMYRLIIFHSTYSFFSVSVIFAQEIVVYSIDR